MITFKNKFLFKHNSFSLVELMVVIAIIGILAAIAVPSYKAYIIKTKIASAIPILKHGLQFATTAYDTTGAWPDPINLYDVSIALGTNVAINVPPVQQLRYSNGTNSAHICIYFSDIGLSGFVANTPGNNDGTYNRLCINATSINDIWNICCGIWGTGGTTDIPIIYLPTGCNSNWLANAYAGNQACNH